MPMTRAHEKIVDFIAAGTSPDDVATCHLSAAAKACVAGLIQQEKTTELDHYLQLEHVMRLAKARARTYLAPTSRYVSAALRRVVAAGADGLGECCLIHEDDTVSGCKVDSDSPAGSAPSSIQDGWSNWTKSFPRPCLALSTGLPTRRPWTTVCAKRHGPTPALPPGHRAQRLTPYARPHGPEPSTWPTPLANRIWRQRLARQ